MECYKQLSCDHNGQKLKKVGCVLYHFDEQFFLQLRNFLDSQMPQLVEVATLQCICFYKLYDIKSLNCSFYSSIRSLLQSLTNVLHFLFYQKTNEKSCKHKQ